MSQYAYWIPDHYPAVIQNVLKFPGGCSTLARNQIRLATCIDGIEGPEKTSLTAARLAQFIGNGNLEKFDRLCGIAMVQRKKRTHGRHVIELNGRIFGEAPFQIVNQCLSLRRVPRHSQGESRAILHLPVLGKRKGCHCRRLCGWGVPIKGFPQGYTGFKGSSPFSMGR